MSNIKTIYYVLRELRESTGESPEILTSFYDPEKAREAAEKESQKQQNAAYRIYIHSVRDIQED